MPPKYTCDHVCFTKGLKVKATYGFKTKPPNRCFDCRAFNVMVYKPLNYCKHRKQRSLCKECGGSSICEHGKIRSTCKECGGGSICLHGKRRSRCKECGGGSICLHGKRRSRCKECLHTKRLQDKDKIIFDEFN